MLQDDAFSLSTPRLDMTTVIIIFQLTDAVKVKIKKTRFYPAEHGMLEMQLSIMQLQTSADADAFLLPK